MSVSIAANQFGTLDAHYPVLLLPVSVQVKFVPTPQAALPYELRVRIYPDQLSLSTHEDDLTADELAAGQYYWNNAPQVVVGQLHDLDHWRPLVARYGAPRAQWILRQTYPTNVTDVAAGADPIFTKLAKTATERWKRAAHACGLPECFSVMLYTQATTHDEVADSPVRTQLFPAGGPRSYSAGMVPQPTTEFLKLTHVVQGNPVGPDALAVGMAPPTDEADNYTPAPEPNALPIGGIDADNRWAVDFTKAKAQGMAVAIPVSQAEYNAGFKRLVVLGVRTITTTDHATTADAGQDTLHQLLADHYYTDGLALVPQGTPTNNTDDVAAGFSSRERTDAEGTFGLLMQTLPVPLPDWTTRPDGQHLVTALGLAEALPSLAGGLGQDTSLAQTFNQALWPATYGYFLEEMLHKVLSPEAQTWVRDFFTKYVLARGPVPALRVGAQPYGVLPTTRFSAWEVPGATGHSYPERLQQVLRQLDATWTERLNPQENFYPLTLSSQDQNTKANLIEPADETANLLTVLGLDATSTEYYQRYLIGPALADALQNYATQQIDAENQLMWADTLRKYATLAPGQNPIYQEFASRVDPAGELLPAQAPPIFGQTFQSTYTKLTDAFADQTGAARQEGQLIDNQPLSETEGLAPFLGVGTGGLNYAQWLATASFEDIRVQDFTSVAQDSNDFLPPSSLLYRLLRQAVLLEYWNAAKQYYKDQGHPLSDAQATEQELFNIATTTDLARWQWLYNSVQEPSTGQKVFLHQYLRQHSASLKTYLAAVAQLGSVPTAQLERLLAEHLDLGSYRLDAWRLAPVAERLDSLRKAQPTGSHLGAFGWLEDVRPADHSVADASGLRHDPDSMGYLHVPSLTHGAAAAILRQGYKSRQLTANPYDPASNRMAVDVSSRRVRAALALLEGLRAGHSLGALLGQLFERALQQHETPADAVPYATYIAKFRQLFPLTDEVALVAGTGQTAPTGVSSEQAARQVVDGAALLRTTQPYPYGLPGLPDAKSDFGAFVAVQVSQLVDDLDALGDLAVSEGVYQAARGNADRAGAVLESVAKGQFPLAPDFVQPAQLSFHLTQRVLLHLPVATATSVTGWPPATTPRGLLAPRLNAWLAQFFPAKASALTFAADYQDAGVTKTTTVSLADAALPPIDLLYLLDEQALHPGSAFDRLLAGAVPGAPPAPTVRYADDAAYPGPAALRSLLPLLARLRQLVGSARPARPHDLLSPGQAAADDNTYAGATLPSFASAKQALLKLDTDLANSTTQRDALRQAVLVGLTEATAALADGANLAAGAATTRQAVLDRLAAAEAVVTEFEAANGTVATPHPALDGDATLRVGAALLGDSFRPDLTFALPSPAYDAYAAGSLPAAAEHLLRHHKDEPLAMQEWLHGVATVREPLAHLDKVFLLHGLLEPDAQYATAASPQGSPLLPLQPAQFSASASVDDYWVGLAWPDGYTPPSEALSLVQWLPARYQPTDEQAALWLDEWTETLPLGSQTTALTFHYDQPNSEAPQSMLLVVSPRVDTTKPWQADDLLGAVNETLDLAKKRTVEPDDLAATHLATVLPAVIAPVAQQAVTMTLDLGSINETARFSEDALLAPENPI
ncbi:MAG: hypothetical protein ACRYG7_08825 [Janthinobacterium lividum]